MSSRIDRDVAAEIERLFLEVSQPLFSYACTLPGVDRSAAEDLIQDAFHDAAVSWNKLASRAPEGRRQWLFKVLRNKAIDQWRMNRNCLPSSEPIESPLAVEDTVHRVVYSTALERCWSAVEKMPPIRQKVAFLRWNEDWSTTEIADWLGIAPVTVRGHLKEARDELIIQVGAQVPFIGDPETGKGG